MLIRVRLLGTAAGGGLPQWNCTCPNCRDARLGKIPHRTQSSVALSVVPGSWFLVNASPDLPAQIESFPELHPGPQSPRNSPINGVLLTNADLDHALGLFSLREGAMVHIHATNAVRQVLEQRIGLTAVLEVFSGVTWHEPPAAFTPLTNKDGTSGHLEYRAIPLPGTPPPFARDLPQTGTHSVAYQFLDRRTGAKLLVAPDVSEITYELKSALTNSDAILFDGTFWSPDELLRIKPGAPPAGKMGHVTIKDCSLPILGGLPARKKLYLHINNTNPVLSPDSSERAAVESAGITIGHDGLEFEL